MFLEAIRLEAFFWCLTNDFVSSAQPSAISVKAAAELFKALVSCKPEKLKKANTRERESLAEMPSQTLQVQNFPITWMHLGALLSTSSY